MNLREAAPALIVKLQYFLVINFHCTWRKIDIQYPVVISRYGTVISKYSASLLKILKYFSINILDNTVEYSDITTKYLRSLSHTSISDMDSEYPFFFLQYSL